MATGERVAATHTPIIAMSAWPQTQEIDLCDEHFKIIEEVDVMIMKYGRSSESEPRSVPTKIKKKVGRRSADIDTDPESQGCPVCLNLYSGRADVKTKYLSQHLRMQHGMSIKDFSDDQLTAATAEARAKIAERS